MTRSPSSGRATWPVWLGTLLLSAALGLGSWFVGAREAASERDDAREAVTTVRRATELVDAVPTTMPIPERAGPSATREAVPAPLAPEGEPAGPEVAKLAHLLGRVVDRDGHGRQASLSVWARDPATGELESLRQIETYDDGRFDLERHPAADLGASWDGAPLPDRPLRLLAESARFGSGIVDLPAARDPEADTVVVLDGPGALRGRVLDASGAPAAGLPLTIELSELQPTPGETRGAHERRALETRLLGGGHVRRTVTTDLEGRFAVRALRLDLHDVRATTDAGEVLLTRPPVLADGRELTLQLERPHLVVRVLDADGRPWACPPVFPPRGDAEGWPGAPHLVVLCVGTEREPSAAIEDASARQIGGATVFELARGASYLVGLLGGDEPWDPVPLEAGDGRRDLELRLTGALVRGTLEVQTFGGGRVLETDVRLRVEDPRSGLPLLRVEELERLERPWTFDVPPGHWRLVVEGRASFAWDTGRRSGPGAVGTFESDIEIREGERTLVRADLPVGARLVLSASGPPCAADARDVTGLGIDRVAVTLTDGSHWPRDVVFDHVPTVSPRGRQPQSHARLGADSVAECLPAGRWTLSGRLADGRTARTEVVLVDGETTEARLVFE